MTDESNIPILVVEDDPRLGREIRDTLEDEGFEVTWLADGAHAIGKDPDDFRLVVLDLMLPGKHGFDILKRFRERSDVPVIILTARTDTHDKVRGFKLGGDDYLTKPFWPEELVARVRARLRRPSIEHEADRSLGPLMIDFERRIVTVDGAEIELTRTEFDILATLARRPGAAITRRRLVERCLDEEREGTERTLDVHVSRIRKKLGDAAEQLQTVWGIGYKLVAPTEEA
jgi:two-component system response regulator MtrA